jgi:hypothetical protein
MWANLYPNPYPLSRLIAPFPSLNSAAIHEIVSLAFSNSTFKAILPAGAFL